MSDLCVSPHNVPDDLLIIGGGPAGLTAGYIATRDTSLRVRILEADPLYVGGISRTEKRDGFSFDVGGHRFFSKSKEIEKLWFEILPDDFLLRPRLSRIFYNNKFYSYPLKAFEALFNLGLVESLMCLASYAKSRITPIPHPKSFTDWVSNQFGKRLFTIFFKTYTEKVWGIGCDELSSDWAAQRIKGLNLAQAVLASLRHSLGHKASQYKGHTIKTLTEEFHYPRLGPGMMWETAANKIKARGGIIHMGQKATHFAWDETQQIWTITARSTDGTQTQHRAKHILSSAPLRDVAQAVTPTAQTSQKASALRYRDFVSVSLILDHPVPFNDNWIYIHDPNVLVGRVQNFGAWSPSLLPSADKGCLGFEYFCFEGDALWQKTEAQLVDLAKAELTKLNLCDPSHVIGGYVVRQPKAYPVYDDDYAETIASIKAEFTERFPTMHFIGRNGMHKYDNQDHAMMTAILTVKNIVAGRTAFDVWSVNEDAAYQEE